MKPVTAMGVALTASILALASGGTSASAPSSEEVVRQLYAAFNAGNAEALVSQVSHEVRWMNVAGESVVVEAAGREALRASMTRYFRSRPTVRSRIEALMPTGDFVTVHERVIWTQGDTERTQSAVAVYKLRNGKITAVWYFDVMP